MRRPLHFLFHLCTYYAICSYWAMYYTLQLFIFSFPLQIICISCLRGSHLFSCRRPSSPTPAALPCPEGRPFPALASPCSFPCAAGQAATPFAFWSRCAASPLASLECVACVLLVAGLVPSSFMVIVGPLLLLRFPPSTSPLKFPALTFPALNFPANYGILLSNPTRK